MKLFDAVVAPSILFGLSALPLYQHHLDKLGTTQRKLMRTIVGWVRHPGEEWNITMRRMNDRLSNASRQYPIKSWNQKILEMQWKTYSGIEIITKRKLVGSILQMGTNEYNRCICAKLSTQKRRTPTFKTG